MLVFLSGDPTDMLQELERKRAELMREVHAVSAAIKAYAETIGKGYAGAVKNGRTKSKPSKRHMSAATKRKLSLAAKARWAKINSKKA
jgi:ribosomal protein L3